MLIALCVATVVAYMIALLSLFAFFMATKWKHRVATLTTAAIMVVVLMCIAPYHVFATKMNKVEQLEDLIFDINECQKYQGYEYDVEKLTRELTIARREAQEWIKRLPFGWDNQDVWRE